MDFAAASEYLLSLGNEVSAMKLGLENIRTLLAAFGNPQNNYLKVQVAGTNGKGSVCAFLDSICVHSGIKTGLYTSPHLISITERIQVNGSDISEADFARHATHVRETVENLLARGELAYRPTFFEQVTAIALVAFAEAKVELSILETGLGGRLDATTAANAEIAAITRIDLDHQEYLGETIEDIAAEKAAIIRKDSIVCVGKQLPEAFEVIADRCSDLGVIPTTLNYARWEPNSPGVDFIMSGFTAEEVFVSLAGEHQYENAALAILVAKQLKTIFPISDMNIIYGLERARHPGRLEWMDQGNIRILLDGAHNQCGAHALARYMTKWHPKAGIVLVYGSMKGKDYDSILETLIPLVNDIILTESGNSRSVSASQIADVGTLVLIKDQVFVIADVRQALDAAVQLAETYPATRQAFVLVTGSLYLVGEVKKLLDN